MLLKSHDVLILDWQMGSHVIEVGFFLCDAPLSFLGRSLFLLKVVQLLLETEVIEPVQLDKLSFVSVYVHF